MIELSNTLPDGFKKSLAEFGFNASPLRAVGFNKSSDSNWSLPWHQDRVIAVPHKTDAPEFKNWSRKSGVWHCEPPAFVLAQIAFAYIVFDDVKDGMGGLELAERSHRHGIVPEKNIAKFVNLSKIVCPSMVTGDVLLVSAMTLHRSALIKTDMRRRALRVDFGATALNLSK
ncbi:MAG: phytanoyl-CoA dioxygenase family protein [Litorimonas sp.]